MLSAARKAFLAALLAVALLLLAACSSATNTPAPTAAGTPTGAPTSGPTPTQGPTQTPQELAVGWERNARLGDILVDVRGMTVYTYKNDKPGESTCTGDCAKTWPPVTVDKRFAPVLQAGLQGRIGAIQRPDGTSQATYNDQPLYLYSGDKNPGDANGEGQEGLWSVVKVTPATPAPFTPTPPATPTNTPAPAATATP